MRNADFVVAGSTDSELRVWQIKPKDENGKSDQKNFSLLGEEDVVDVPVSF